MHRKTAVEKEHWALIEDWYIDPKFIDMKTYELPSALAHRCSDGNIRALEGPGAYKSRKTGLIRIYGKCRGCKKPVGREAHTVINMLKVL